MGHGQNREGMRKLRIVLLQSPKFSLILYGRLFHQFRLFQNRGIFETQFVSWKEVSQNQQISPSIICTNLPAVGLPKRGNYFKAPGSR